MNGRAIAARPAAGTASYGLSNLAVKDFGTLFNALENAPSTPATVSFNVLWQVMEAADWERSKIHSGSQGYEGEFFQSEDAGAALLEWSATMAGFEFQSDPAATSASYFAQVGEERNGVFFGSEKPHPRGLTSRYPNVRGRAAARTG